MSKSKTQNIRKDALPIYDAQFSKLNIPNTHSGEEALRALYTIALGEGMIESDGNYSTGYDQCINPSDNKIHPEIAEAGIFQTSYDSITKTPELKQIYAEYRAHPEKCYLDLFKRGVRDKHEKFCGTGPGLEFQSFNKECPAFSTEYAMVAMRVSVGQFGPVLRDEVEISKDCNEMLEDIEKLVEQDATRVCQELS